MGPAAGRNTKGCLCSGKPSKGPQRAEARAFAGPTYSTPGRTVKKQKHSHPVFIALATGTAGKRNEPQTHQLMNR